MNSHESYLFKNKMDPLVICCILYTGTIWFVVFVIAFLHATTTEGGKKFKAVLKESKSFVLTLPMQDLYIDDFVRGFISANCELIKTN